MPPLAAKLAGRVARIAALLMLAWFLATSVPPALLRSVFWMRQASSSASAEQQRRRFYGDAWVDAVAVIERAVPPQGEYLLVNGDAAHVDAPYWVRYELAPRRARLVDNVDQLDRDAGAASEWVVVAFLKPHPPLLVRRAELARRLALRGDGG
jgi:hypothetical protein